MPGQKKITAKARAPSGNIEIEKTTSERLVINIVVTFLIFSKIAPRLVVVSEISSRQNLHALRSANEGGQVTATTPGATCAGGGETRGVEVCDGTAHADAAAPHELVSTRIPNLACTSGDASIQPNPATRSVGGGAATEASSAREAGSEVATQRSAPGQDTSHGLEVEVEQDSSVVSSPPEDGEEATEGQGVTGEGDAEEAGDVAARALASAPRGEDENARTMPTPGGDAMPAERNIPCILLT